MFLNKFSDLQKQQIELGKINHVNTDIYADKNLSELMMSSCRIALEDGASEESVKFLLDKYKKKEISEETFYTLIKRGIYLFNIKELKEKYRPPLPKNTGYIIKSNRSDAFIGGVFGDIIGSPLEGTMYHHTLTIKEMMKKKTTFTDDTILMIATKKVLDEKKVIGYRDELSLNDFKIANTYPYISNPFTDMYRTYGRKYKDAGFGEKFYHWLRTNSKEPYGSYGNGSAMRVGVIADYFDLDKVMEYSIASAATTHNHVDGIKGAVVISVICWMAKNGYTKDEILDYMKQFYSLETSRKYAMPHIKSFDYKGFSETMGMEVCQYTVPMAVFCFYNSNSFEDAINNGLTLIGDIDTICSITGAIAGSYYGIPDYIRKYTIKKINRMI